MDDYSSARIPFGVDADTGVLKGVEEVPRGGRCNCVCPCCQGPLIARQGEINEWHFAHASRGVFERTEELCEFAFFISVRMMARQVLSTPLPLRLPGFTGQVSASVGGARLEVPFEVTKASEVTVEALEIETSFHGVPVDALGRVRARPFALYFVHPGRDVPAELYDPPDKSCGVIAITLDSVGAVLLGAESRSQALRQFIEADKASKHWLYHPRCQTQKEKAMAELEALKANRPAMQFRPTRSKAWQPSKPIRSPGKAARKNFKCALCDARWQDVENNAVGCPNGHAFPYRSEV